MEVISRPVFLNRENAAELLEGADVIVDALDRIDIRLILEDAAGELDRPLVHGAIGGFLGEIATVLPGRSRFSNLYPATEDREGGLEKVLGTPTPVPAVVAAFEVIETIKLLLGKGRPFSEEILYLELLDGYFSRIRLKS